jgi:hypothetical protein
LGSPELQQGQDQACLLLLLLLLKLRVQGWAPDNPRTI